MQHSVDRQVWLHEDELHFLLPSPLYFSSIIIKHYLRWQNYVTSKPKANIYISNSSLTCGVAFRDLLGIGEIFNTEQLLSNHLEGHAVTDLSTAETESS